jgi:hypothetical protein
LLLLLLLWVWLRVRPLLLLLLQRRVGLCLLIRLGCVWILLDRTTTPWLLQIEALHSSCQWIAAVTLYLIRLPLLVWLLVGLLRSGCVLLRLLGVGAVGIA